MYFHSINVFFAMKFVTNEVSCTMLLLFNFLLQHIVNNILYGIVTYPCFCYVAVEGISYGPWPCCGYVAVS